METPAIGSIVWHDLTVPAAEEVKDFYCGVIGWNAGQIDMGGYNDFPVATPSGQTVGGICHARGSNSNLPPQWLIYVQVEDVARSAERCVELGGKVLEGPRSLGESRFCVIQDPAGAVMGLMSA